LRGLGFLNYFPKSFYGIGDNADSFSGLETVPKAALIVYRLHPVGQLRNYLIWHRRRYPIEVDPTEDVRRILKGRLAFAFQIPA
jgi:hypothetical protein